MTAAGAAGTTRALLDRLEVPGDIDVALEEAPDVFGSPFRVTIAAQALVSAFLATIAHLESDRRGRPVRAAVDGLHAAASFHSERLLSAPQLDRDLWAPLSGNYRAADGWLRVHANLAPHAAAVRDVLDLRGDDATAAIADRVVDALVTDIQAAGGVAVPMRTLQQWHRHPHHAHLAAQPLITRVDGPACPPGPGPHALLHGVRVVDCTRVIAGPVAGRLLSSFGAQVTKVDAPLDDSPTLELDTGWGKDRAAVDLRTVAGRARFEQLVTSADVLLEGFRPGALSSLGYDDECLWALRPQLVIGHLSAFGETGPLGGLRGFDSVVQVATGIAHRCGFDDVDGPSRLPAQALDHGAGHLLAAAVVRLLTQRRRHGRSGAIRLSLARVGEWLVGLGAGTGGNQQDLRPLADPYMRTIDDPDRGTIEHVGPVGSVDGRRASWPPRALPPRRE